MYENVRTCLFTHVFMYFLHLVLTFTPPPPLHHNGKGSIEHNSQRYERAHGRILSSRASLRMTLEEKWRRGELDLLP